MLALVSGATVLPAAAATNKPAATHKLVVAVAKNLSPTAEKKLAVLVLISQSGGAAAGAVATPSKPLSVLLARSGLYRVTIEIDSSCKGRCAASYRLSGSADHKLRVVPSCRLNGAGLTCSKVKIVRAY